MSKVAFPFFGEEEGGCPGSGPPSADLKKKERKNRGLPGGKIQQ